MNYKIVDLFAGPGGLGEGFASYKGDASFEIAVSAEMEESAHKTLTLRSFFRHIQGDQKALAAYYDFCHSADAPHPGTLVPAAWRDAQAEANQLTLGEPAHNHRLDELIGKAKLKRDETVLIGGPPCQAYSLVGRSRNRGKEDYVAEDDHRHFLYREYLRILNTTRPAVFVMENVKGILSSKVNGKLVFHDILRDLAEPGKALGKPDGIRYTIHSLVSPVHFKAGMEPDFIDANAFIIEAEKYGIPQARHRVILLGVREELGYDGRHLLEQGSSLAVDQAIFSLPQLRSKLSTGDSDDHWRFVVQELAKKLQADAESKGYDQLALRLRGEAIKLGLTLETGALRYKHQKLPETPSPFVNWVKDDRLDVWLNHESRSHMFSDLARYFYTAVFGLLNQRTPKGHLDFPLVDLAPQHKNWESGKFIDRFRVQLHNLPSTTVTSHIAKDGHYFIHPDPSQCRSLTVREAARLQTFPDNYFFQGNRTQQYHQVGNAVPSLLANKIAHVVQKILTKPASRAPSTG
ncbi:MAG: DNA (cytosine-5-)-methyltransferase [Hydrogenophaga sp.]|nr:DNA (cytosine-5-)-methyltransferase [Hydrogenophaga sp.]